MSTITQEFVATLATILNSANIPCILWGHCLLNVYGVPSVISSIDFVIPNECLQLSIAILATRIGRLVPCADSNACTSGSYQRRTPPPAFHVHLLDDPDITVGLFTQSDTLWFLPSLKDVVPCRPGKLDETSLFINASDHTMLPPWRPGRGTGVFVTSKQNQFIVVPRAAILLEAFMRIYARDSGKQIGSFAMAMIDYMDMYVDDDGYLNVTALPDPFRSFYQQLKIGEKPVGQWTRELRAALEISRNDESI